MSKKLKHSVKKKNTKIQKTYKKNTCSKRKLYLRARRTKNRRNTYTKKAKSKMHGGWITGYEGTDRQAYYSLGVNRIQREVLNCILPDFEDLTDPKPYKFGFNTTDPTLNFNVYYNPDVPSSRSLTVDSYLKHIKSGVPQKIAYVEHLESVSPKIMFTQLIMLISQCPCLKDLSSEFDTTIDEAGRFQQMIQSELYQMSREINSICILFKNKLEFKLSDVNNVDIMSNYKWCKPVGELNDLYYCYSGNSKTQIGFYAMSDEMCEYVKCRINILMLYLMFDMTGVSDMLASQGGASSPAIHGYIRRCFATFAESLNKIHDLENEFIKMVKLMRKAEDEESTISEIEQEFLQGMTISNYYKQFCANINTICIDCATKFITTDDEVYETTGTHLFQTFEIDNNSVYALLNLTQDDCYFHMDIMWRQWVVYAANNLEVLFKVGIIEPVQYPFIQEHLTKYSDKINELFGMSNYLEEESCVQTLQKYIDNVKTVTVGLNDMNQLIVTTKIVYSLVLDDILLAIYLNEEFANLTTNQYDQETQFRWVLDTASKQRVIQSIGQTKVDRYMPFLNSLIPIDAPNPITYDESSTGYNSYVVYIEPTTKQAAKQVLGTPGRGISKFVGSFPSIPRTPSWFPKRFLKTNQIQPSPELISHTPSRQTSIETTRTYTESSDNGFW